MSEDNSLEWEAAQWVARRMGDQPFDNDGFDAWLAGDPRRKTLFDAMWPRIMGPQMDKTLDAVVRRRRRSKRNVVIGSMAAAAIFVGGYQALPLVELFLIQPQSYAAADGTLREVTLEDGTQLTLAGGAEVHVRYVRHMREIELTRGTVFANVRHDGTRPFRVNAVGARITDLGTRFEVASKPAFVRVTVESGAVQFGANGWFSKSLNLTAGQTAALVATELGRVEDVSQDGVARWRNEWVEYHDTPLTQVVADLESVAALPIRIATGNLSTLRVTGRIRLIDPMRQINNLATIHNFSVETRDDAIILSNRQ